MSAVAAPVAEGVWRIPTAPLDLVNSYAFRDDDGQVTLVDAGIPGSSPRILAALATIGSAPSDVTRILLTHAHSDHAGGVAKLRTTTGGDVAIHADDADFVRTGTLPPSDPSSLGGRLLTRVSAHMGFKAAPVAQELHDGEVLDIAGGLRVIHTPGHSPGHVSLLHEPAKLLITGDAIWNIRTRVTWPILLFCADVPLSQQTAEVLGELDYEVAAFTHGPPIHDGARAAVRSFLRQPRRFRAGF